MKVNEIITQKFIKALSENIIPWQKPWHSANGFQNAVTGRHYNGVNVLMLSLFGKDSFFLTYKQAQEVGAQVKKGSEGLPIIFCAPYEKKTKEGEKEQALALRYYSVFNLSDCETPEGFKAKGESASIVFEPQTACESVLNNVDISFGGSKAAYSPKEHKIMMPLKERFLSSAHYYVVTFHEMIHREAKELGEELTSSHESESYSKEELTAEIGANFLANACQLDVSATWENSVGYVAGWLKRLKEDPQLIISAASKAQKRVDSILKRSGLILETTENL